MPRLSQWYVKLAFGYLIAGFTVGALLLAFLFSNKIKMLFRRGGSAETTADDSNMLLTQMDDVTTVSEDEDDKPAAALK